MAELRAVESLPPPPEPELEPPARQAPEVIPFEPRPPAAPREWNVWDLERVVREQEIHDATKDEERSYLLINLRPFANADGILPLSFDSIVRESFGDLVGP